MMIQIRFFLCIECGLKTYLMICQRKKEVCIVARNHDCKETDSINSVQSFMKFQTFIPCIIVKNG